MPINVTPPGMEGPDSAALALPGERIVARSFAFDVMALLAGTPFIRAAETKARP